MKPMIRQEIAKLTEESIKELQRAKKLPEFDVPEIQIKSSEREGHGDYATNVAMIIAKKAKKSPMETAELLNSKFKIPDSKFFDKVEAVKPGFINFFLSTEYLQKQVEEILKEKEKYGEIKIGKGKSVNVEFICANPTGELHIGHGRGAFFGNTLVKVLKRAGYKVSTEYYANDAENSSQIRELGKTALGQGKTYLNDYLEKKIKSLKQKLNNCKDERKAGVLLAQEVQKDIKNFIEKKLKIKFDNWVSEEKDLYQTGKIDKVFKWLKKNKLVYEKDGAQWLRTSQYGDEKDWVVVRKTGEFTYLLPDLIYHKNRFDRNFNKIINIWGADHQAHVGKIKAVAKILGFEGDLDILISQVVRLKREKISKRTGKTLTLDWLINEVGLDAARFFYLTKSLDTQMEFDIELAKEKTSKSPVYYAQYAYARICSILKKLKTQNAKFKTEAQNLELLNHQSELSLIKRLIKLPEIIADISKDYQIQRLPQYAIDLAADFHQFYRDCRVISDDKKLTQARLGLVLAAKTVLKNTLDLMGISAPEKM